ncbi:MAG: ABC transporter substrate-binding protein, partial [Betaproteobacteria bacterium]|nr:ABC transporter substrate-binding protein [Betaproteobacteria bacterium]
TKLLDVDKVDLLIAPYGTVPTAPIMPLVKERKKLLMGNFSFQVNAKVQHDMWFNNSPWNDASSWSDGFFRAGTKAGAKSTAILAADNDFAQSLANGADHAARKRARKAPDGQLLVPGEREGAARHVFQQLAVERRVELVGRLLCRGQEGGRKNARGARRRQRLRPEPGERCSHARGEGGHQVGVRPELSADDH